MRELTVAEAIEQAQVMAGSGRRALLGLAGCPGAGKSTLSALIAEALGVERCSIVPMDGFHLDNPVLERHGTRSRKGAPMTFDAAGYSWLLHRLRAQRPDEVVFAPRYDRALSTSVAGAIEVAGTVPLIVTEGNYLLLDEGPWRSVRPFLDACWYVHVPDELRLARLIARHIEFGKPAADAEAWVMGSDEANAALVTASAARADAVVRLA